MKKSSSQFIAFTHIIFCMMGLMIGTGIGGVFFSKPQFATEHLVPVKVVGTCRYGYNAARIVEIRATKQRCYVKGVIGEPGDEFTIDPDALIDYRPLLPPKESK